MKVSGEVWLAGKGPSLDVFDWSNADWCRIGINEAALLIPDCYAAVAMDDPVLERFALDLDPEILVCVQHKTKIVFPNMYIIQRDVLANGTAPMMIAELGRLGVKIIHFIGFDSINNASTKYSDKIRQIKSICRNQDGFRSINRRIIHFLKKYKVKPIWEHLYL